MLRKGLIVLMWGGVDLLVFGLAVSAIILPLFAAAGANPPAQIATTILNRLLPLGGIDDARATVSDIRLDGAVIEDVSVGGGIALERIVLSYAPDIIATRTVDQVSVEGIRLAFGQDHAEPQATDDRDLPPADPLAWLARVLSAMDARRDLPVSVRRLDVWGIEADATTLRGTSVSINGGLTALDPFGLAPEVESSFAVSARDARGRVRAVASLKGSLETGDNGLAILTLGLDGGRGTIADAAVADLNATATMTLDLTGQAVPLVASVRVRGTGVTWRDQSWPEARMDLLLTEAGGSAGIMLGAREGVAVDLAATVDGPATERPVYAARWSADLTPLGELAALLPASASFVGEGEISGEISGRAEGRLPSALVPFDPDRWRHMDWRPATAQGEILAEGEFPSWEAVGDAPVLAGIKGGRTSARIGLSAARGVVALDLLPGSRVSAESMEAGPSIPASLSPLLSEDGAVLTPAEGGEPPRVTVSWSPARNVDVSGRFVVSVPAAEPLSVDLAAEFAERSSEASPTSEGWRLSVRELALNGLAVPVWDQPLIQASALAVSGEIEPDRMALSVTSAGTVTLDGSAIGPLSGPLSLAGRFTMAEERARFELDRLTVQPADGAVTCVEPVTIAQSPGQPAIRARILDAGLRLEESILQFSIPSCRLTVGDSGYALAVDTVTLRVGGSPDAADLLPLSLDMDIRNGRLSATGPVGLSADRINGAIEARLSDDGLRPRRVELVSGAVALSDRDLLRPPLRVALEMRPTGDGGPSGPLSLDMVVADAGARFGAEVTGTVAFADTVSADLFVDMPVIAVGADGTSLDMISPTLAALVAGGIGGRVDGRLSARGRILWPSGELEESEALTIRLEGGRFESEVAEISGASASLAFRSLQPPTSFPQQPFSVERAIVGVVLKELNGGMELTGDGGLLIPAVAAGFADGRLLGEAIAWRPGEPFSSVLAAEDLNVSVLVPLLDLKGLAATGRVSGRVPVTFSPELGFMVDQGVLEATDAGTVQYAPDQPPAGLADSGPQVSLMLQAIENFHYDRLMLSLDGRSGTGFSVGATLEGSNPDLYDGYPVELNATLSGQLDEILRNALRTYRIQETIGDRVQGLGLGG